MFEHSVVLLDTHSSQTGALGLILNRPTGHCVSQYLGDAAFAPLAAIPVHLGGPVEREQLSFSALAWNESGLAWDIQLPAAEAVQRSRQAGTVVRAFIGHSEWTQGQLEGELRQGAWVTSKPSRAIFHEEHDDRLWRHLMRHISPYHRVIAETPKTPWLN